MKAMVDRELCIGCKACEIHCPDIFKIDDAGISTVIFEGELAGDHLVCAQQAEEACPSGAIRVEGEGGFPEEAKKGV